MVLDCIFNKLGVGNTRSEGKTIFTKLEVGVAVETRVVRFKLSLIS